MIVRREVARSGGCVGLRAGIRPRPSRPHAEHPRNINRRWDELRARAGMSWLRLHDLRHGCATLLLAAGVPPRTIMDVLGHSEIGVTMNTYAHVLPELRHDAADADD